MPLDETDDDTEVTGILLRILADVLTQYGIPPRDVFGDRFELTTPTDDVEIRLPLSLFREYLRNAVKLTGERAFGIHCGLRTSSAAFGILGALMSSAPTLREALNILRRYRDLVFTGAYFRVFETAGTALLRWDFPRAGNETDHIIADFLNAATTRLLQAFGAQQKDIVSVRFRHCRSRNYHAYLTAFDHAVRLSQSVTGVEFNASLLDRPSVRFDPTARNVALAQVEERCGNVPGPMMTLDRLRILFMTRPATCMPTLDEAAHSVGTSSRTLRRRLSTVGHTYRSFAHQALFERALPLVQCAELELETIASSLGFKSTASFRRAFVRWRGLDVSHYRLAVDARPLTRCHTPA